MKGGSTNVAIDGTLEDNRMRTCDGVQGHSL